MSLILAALAEHAARTPEKIAMQDGATTLSYGAVLLQVQQLAAQLQRAAPGTTAILADNSCAWALADLAGMLADHVIIPIPPYFSPGQIAHVLKSAGIAHILTDQAERLLGALALPDVQLLPFHGPLQHIRLPPDPTATTPLPAGTRKVTFTSGTTGEPKGVCLGLPEMENVARSLQVASDGHGTDRHLCLLPLATLLENIGGIYTPLLAGATICLPRLAEVGLSGSSGLDIRRLLGALNDWQASTAIMVPQMLQAAVAAAQAGIPAPGSLRYLAVGGAPLAATLSQQAAALGFPVYQGYGLSECASVVALNSPRENRPGSVGKPLPHLRLSFAPDGEILISGITWRGYLGETQHSEPIATGDLGYLDSAGYLFLTGRKKNIFITSFGRNVAPEWVEGELAAHPGIIQAAVFGEARPYNTAVIVPYPGASTAAIQSALDKANLRLPDYAQVRTWIPAREAFTAQNGLATPNGRLRRQAIFERYTAQLNTLYQP